jgi:hypothetical protein
MRNSVMYNHIHNVMEKLHDGAGIYTLGLQSGSVVKGNYIHDNMFSGERYREAQYLGLVVDKVWTQFYYDKYGAQITDTKSKGFRGGSPGGVYLDEASGGFYVSENVVHSVAYPFHLNDNGIANRRFTNWIYDNYFNYYPDEEDFPHETARFAGILPEYVLIKNQGEDI